MSVQFPLTHGEREQGLADTVTVAVTDTGVRIPLNAVHV